MIDLLCPATSAEDLSLPEQRHGFITAHPPRSILLVGIDGFDFKDFTGLKVAEVGL